MVLAFLIFWIPIVVGLKEADIYWPEAGLCTVLWAALLSAYLFWPVASIASVAAVVLLDLILIIKVVGPGASAY